MLSKKEINFVDDVKVPPQLLMKFCIIVIKFTTLDKNDSLRGVILWIPF